MDFSIIIVNYNSGRFLLDCVKSILNNLGGLSYEIIVVDNNSSDSSFSDCASIDDKRLILIQSGDNLGFSRANNIGAKHASGKFLHFLNPDTQISESLKDDYKRILIDFSTDVHCVYVNPLRDKDGTTYYGKSALPGTMNWIKYYLCRNKVNWYYMGASVIIPTVDFNKIGKWNEKIFMYGEDADIFYRMNMYQLPIVELPSVIFHYGGGSSQKAFTNMAREILIQKSLRIYYKSNHLFWLDYWTFQIIALSTFIKKPMRLWWQIKAIYLSFFGE